jgi:hypothetical protein
MIINNKYENHAELLRRGQANEPMLEDDKITLKKNIEILDVMDHVRY